MAELSTYSEEQAKEDSNTFSEYNDVEVYGTPKLKDIMNWIVAEIPDEWEGVGIQLNISSSKLNAIKVNTSCGGQPRMMFREVMKLWEDCPHPETPYNWETILNALSSPAVGKELLANEVADKVKNQSQLPVEQKPCYTAIDDITKHYRCGCGECTLDDIITKGCNNPNAIPRFPILDVLKLPQCKRIQYEYMLLEEADLINIKFGSLIDDIRESLCNRKIDPKSVISFLKGSKLLQTTAETRYSSSLRIQLNQAQDIGDIFNVLSDITSWFNHHPLGLLVERYGSEEDREAYTNFIEVHVMKYLRKSVTEIPKDAFYSSIKGSGHFRLKLDHPSSHEYITGQQIFFLRGRVAKILDIEIECLHLTSIEKGCLELELSIPFVIYKKLFSPLSIAQCKKFETAAVEGPNNIPITIKHIEYEGKVLKIPVPPETIFFATLFENLPGIVVTYSKASKDIQDTFTSAKSDLEKLKENKDKVDKVEEIEEFYRCLDRTKHAAYKYLERVCEIPKKLSENSNEIMKELERGEQRKLETLRGEMNEGLDKCEQLHTELTYQCHRLVKSCEKAAKVCETRKEEAKTRAAVGGAVGVGASLLLGIVTLGAGSVIAGAATAATVAITAAIIAWFALGAIAFKNIGITFGEMEAKALLQLQKNISKARELQVHLANEGLETILRNIEREATKGYTEAAKELEKTRRVLWT